MASRYVLEIEPRAFVVDGLDVESEREESRMTQKFFSLINWKDGFSLRYRKVGLMEDRRLSLGSLLDIKSKCQGDH